MDEHRQTGPEQRGTLGPHVPKRRRDGSDSAHHRVRTDGEQLRWPRGLTVRAYFDYGTAGNTFADQFGFTSVATVNGDDHDLILGWELFRVAGRIIAPSLFWAIRPEGPVETVVAPPRTPHP